MTRPSFPLLFFPLLALLASSTVASAAPPGRAERCVAAAEHGQQDRDRGAFLDARATFRSCAADECPPLVRKDCAQWLTDLESNIPSVVVGAKDSQGHDVLGARILIDGRPYQEEIDSGRAIPLDPGPHTFRFEHPPDAVVELTEMLRVGEHNRPIYGMFAPPKAPLPLASLASPPPPGATTTPPPSHPLPPRLSPSAPTARASRISPWAYALGAVAVAGGASFAYFGATGQDEKNQLRAQCGSTCSDAEVQPLKVKYVTADVSLGVGVIAAVLSTWLFLHPEVGEISGSAKGRATFSFALGREGAGASVQGSF